MEPGMEQATFNFNRTGEHEREACFFHMNPISLNWERIRTLN